MVCLVQHGGLTVVVSIEAAVETLRGFTLYWVSQRYRRGSEEITLLGSDADRETIRIALSK